jgi:hypothetical protein
MNLENFRKDYLKVITESTDTDLKAYIRSIVEEVMKEGRMHAADQPGYGKIGKETAAAVDVMMPGAYIKASMIPKEYDLDKIEAALKAAKKEMSKDEYNGFLGGMQYQAQKELLSKYNNIDNLKLANDFLNYLMDN